MATKMKAKKAKVTGKAKPKPREKQTFLEPDMAPPSYPDIDMQVDSYSEAESDAAAAEEIMEGCTERLMELMKAKNLEYYRSNGRAVKVSSTEKIKVTRVKEATAIEVGA